MAAAAIPLLIGGGIMSAVGSIKQGQDNAQMANYNAQIAQQNAAIVEQQGAEASRRSLVNSRKMTGAGIAAYGASGVSGASEQFVIRSSAAQGELNALTIQHNADIRATAYQNESNLDRMRAGNDQTAGYMGAAASLLSMGGKMAGAAGGGSGGGGGEDVGDTG